MRIWLRGHVSLPVIEPMPTQSSTLSIKGTRNDRLSWDRSEVVDLDNGHRLHVSFSFYGDMVSRVTLPDGSFWHCSNGLDKVPESCAGYRYAALPEFARLWIEDLRNDHGTFASLVRPRFERVHSSAMAETA